MMADVHHPINDLEVPDGLKQGEATNRSGLEDDKQCLHVKLRCSL